MSWSVKFTNKSAKQTVRLPQRVQDALQLLIRDIAAKGPVRGEWPNYGKLGPRRHHCHLKKGVAPTYVAVWEERDGKIQIVEITYVGTHGKAPY